MSGLGGFLPLEPARPDGEPYHGTPCLSTGRACFRLLLDHLRPRRAHVPFFACDALLVPLRRLGIRICFYGLDARLRPTSPAPEVGQGDVMVVVRYFGIDCDWVEPWATRLGPRLIVDDTQAFFQRGLGEAWSFNSARKFLGVADGAYFYGPLQLPVGDLPARRTSIAHLLSRRDGDEEVALREFRSHEAQLDDALLTVSLPSRTHLARIDYAAIAAARRRNFRILSAHLAPLNELDLHLGPTDVPLYYPLLTSRPLRRPLHGRAIWVPQLWPEIADRPAEGFAWERRLASHLCPLPLDQRYGDEDMRRVVSTVFELRQGCPST